MPLKLAALALTAITLVPSATHLFELPAKIDLSQENYFAVQGIYVGWAWFVVPIAGAIVANLALFFVEQPRDRVAARFALVAGTLIILSLGVFFVWVFPANQATANWTEMPGNWRDLRQAWEYGHAANAVILFAALAATGRAIAGGDRVART